MIPNSIMAAATHGVPNTPVSNILGSLSIAWLDTNNNEYTIFKATYSKTLDIDDLHWNYYKDKASFLNTLKTIELPHKVILIASGRLATEIMEDIDGLEQVQSVFIFCKVLVNYQELPNSYCKIVGVYNNRKFLAEALKAHLIDSQQKETGKIGGILTKSVFINHFRSIIVRNGQKHEIGPIMNKQVRPN